MRLRNWIVETFFSRQVEECAKKIVDERFKPVAQPPHVVSNNYTFEKFATCIGFDGYSRLSRMSDDMVKKEWIMHYATELSEFVQIRETGQGSRQIYIMIAKPEQ